MSILQIKNLSKSFKTGKNVTSVLDGISLEINKGDIFGVIGLSGEGKSTLVRCINRLEQADSGSIYFNDDEIIEVGLLDGSSLRNHRNFFMIIS